MKKIMELDEYEDAIFYRASCSCGDQRQDTSLYLELDRETDMIYLHLFSEVYYSSYWTDNWFIDKWYRIKDALRLIFTGKIKIENTFLFEGEEQIKDFINMLQIGIEKLKTQNEKEKNEKN